jgi:hypothetical protein
LAALAALFSTLPPAAANECANLPVQPFHRTVLPGQSAAFTFSELGVPLAAIQWHRVDGVIDPAVASASLRAWQPAGAFRFGEEHFDPDAGAHTRRFYHGHETP